jgi:hypothetical protein
MLCLLERIPGICDLESEIGQLKTKAESISKQLGAWIHSLRDSGLKGQRFVCEKSRTAARVNREREEVLKELQSYRATPQTTTPQTPAD